MEILPPPNLAEIQDFQFKFQNKSRIFESTNGLPNGPCNMVAVASSHGLLFVGTLSNEILVFHTKDLIEYGGEEWKYRSVATPSVPYFLAINCNHDILAAVLEKNFGNVVLFYDVKSFSLAVPIVIQEIRINSNVELTVNAIQWNPCNPEEIALCTNDGSLSVYQLKNSLFVVQTQQTLARSLCWSPKGKQLVTGNLDGTLSQYKPDLSLVKSIPAPNIFNNTSQCIAIHWISNFQFCVVYSDPSDLDSRPCVTIVNTPKAAPVTCINFEDTCYSSGSIRPVHYYLQSLANWGIILTSSSNSIEVGVLGCNEQATWQQWFMNDEARAELPLTKNKLESYPIGFAFDTAAIHQLTYGEDELLPHMPMLHLLSHTGLLVTFNIINTNPAAANICTIPKHIILPDSLLKKSSGDSELPVAIENNPIQQPSFIAPQNVITSTPVLSKSNSPFGLNNTSKPPVATNLFGVMSQMQSLAQDQTGSSVNIFQHSPIASMVAPPKQAMLPNSTQFAQQQMSQVAVTSQISKEDKPHDSSQLRPQEQEPVYSEPQNINQPPQAQGSVSSAKQDIIRQQLLLKEANNFQSDVYCLLVEASKVDTKIGCDDDIQEINRNLKDLHLKLSNFCDQSDLMSQVDDLKRDILQSLCILAEAKAQPNSYELRQIANLDPVSAKQQVSIKRLLYYVEGQTRQANQVLDQQWEAFQSDCRNKLKITGSDNMLKPSLDTVYQPLVRQHEILSRQRSILAHLKQTIHSSGLAMGNKSLGTLLKPKYAGQKNDETLSKLAKNILNMSLEPTDILTAKHQSVCESYSKLTLPKLNALREKFSNHKTITIKPVKVELLSKSDQLNLIANEILLSDSKATSNTEQAAEHINTSNLLNGTSKKEPSEILNSYNYKFKENVDDNENPCDRTLMDVPKSDVSANSFMGINICSPMPATKTVINNYSGAAIGKNTNFALKNDIESSNDNKNSMASFHNSTAVDPKPFSFSRSVVSKPQTFSQSPAVKQTDPRLNPLSSVHPITSIPNTIHSPSDNIFTALAQPDVHKISKLTTAFPVVHPIANSSIPKTSNQNLLGSNPSVDVSNNKPATLATSTATTLFNTQFSSKPTSAFTIPVPKSQSGAVTNIPSSENTLQSVIKPEAKLAPLPMSSLPISKPVSLKQEPISSISSPLPAQTFAAPSTQKQITQLHTDTPETVSLLHENNVDKSVSPNTFVTSISQKSFATSPPSTSANISIFGSPKSELKTGSIFGSTTAFPISATSIFGSPAQNPGTLFSSISNQQPASADSLFASPALAEKAENSLNVTTTTVNTSSVTASIFEAITTTSVSIFGPLKTGSVTSSASIFAAASSSPTTSTSLFATPSSTPSTTATTPASIFAAASSSPANSTSLFGTPSSTPSTTAPTPASIFAASSSSPATSPSLFGTPSSTPFTTASIFAPALSESTAMTSIFGSATNTPVTSTPTLFGTATTTSNSSALMFGSQSTSTVSATPLFGTPTSKTSASIFGTSTNTSSMFGRSSSTAATPASIFSNNANNVANLFESANISPSASNTNAFGNSGGSIFGGSTTFGQSGGASLFSGGTNNTSSSFGQKTVFENNGFGTFGAPAAQTNIFGSPTGGAFSATHGAAFGSSPASVFGAATTQSQGFGSPQTRASTFGASSIFGSKPTFGQAPAFGSSAGGNFGTFSASNEHQSVAQAGFGSPSAFQKSPGGFGSSTFGGSPQMSGFGAAPSFGSQPMFGSGSPAKPFGSPTQTPSPGFGTPTQQSSTFENLAGQNTLTFGNLAQQTPPPSQQPVFQTSPSFSGWRG